jgi:hypothetical protein
MCGTCKKHNKGASCSECGNDPCNCGGGCSCGKDGCDGSCSK